MPFCHVVLLLLSFLCEPPEHFDPLLLIGLGERTLVN